MKSKDRNKPCPCGSGKKTKKCFPFHNQPQVIDVKNIDYINYEMKQDEEFLYHIVHKEIYVKFKDVGLKGGGYPWKGYFSASTDSSISR